MNHFPSATYKLTNFLINFFFIFHFSFLLYTLYNFSIFHIVSYFRLSVIMLSRSTVQWVDWDRGWTGTWIRSKTWSATLLGVVNVLSNIEFFVVVNIMRWQITSGSTNLNLATLTTPKHSK